MRDKFEKLPFTKMIFVASLLFLIIVVLIDFFIGLSKFSLGDVINNMTSWTYISRKILVAFVYGLIIAFIYKRKQKKAAKS
jgi:ABC-type antimicrobial peptide transport system permease subunit